MYIFVSGGIYPESINLLFQIKPDIKSSVLVTIVLISFNKVNFKLGLKSYRNNNNKRKFVIYVCTYWVFLPQFIFFDFFSVWHFSEILRRFFWSLPSPWIVLDYFTSLCGGNLGN